MLERPRLGQNTNQNSNSDLAAVLRLQASARVFEATTFSLPNPTRVGWDRKAEANTS